MGVYTEESAFATSYQVPSSCKNTPAKTTTHHMRETHNMLFGLRRAAECKMLQRIIVNHYLGVPCFTETLQNYCDAYGTEFCWEDEKEKSLWHRCTTYDDPKYPDFLLRASQGTLKPEEIKAAYSRREQITIDIPTECEL